MDRIRFHIRQILVYFKASYQYRVHFLGIVIQNLAIFILFFLFFHWTGKLGDLSDRALITYYLLLLGFFSHMIPTVDLSFTETLRSGKLDSILTMPVDLKLYFVTLHLENLIFNWILNSIFCCSIINRKNSSSRIFYTIFIFSHGPCNVPDPLLPDKNIFHHLHHKPGTS